MTSRTWLMIFTLALAVIVLIGKITAPAPKSVIELEKETPITNSLLLRDQYVGADVVNIELNASLPLTGLSLDAIKALRAKVLKDASPFVKQPYQASEVVFGEISSRRPWIRLNDFYYYGKSRWSVLPQDKSQISAASFSRFKARSLDSSLDELAL